LRPTAPARIRTLETIVATGDAERQGAGAGAGPPAAPDTGTDRPSASSPPLWLQEYRETEIRRERREKWTIRGIFLTAFITLAQAVIFAFQLHEMVKVYDR
jgi:hypothetical protein